VLDGDYLQTERPRSDVSDAIRGLRYTLPSAVVGGAVYVAFSATVGGGVDWVEGAVFMFVFGLVVTAGMVYADRRDGDERNGPESP
jgi:hypothetical protein